MIRSLIQLFSIKLFPNMHEQEKKRQRIYELLSAENKPKKLSEKIRVSLWPNPKPFDYVIWGVLENKTNVTSHPKIGLLKSTIEEE